MYTGQVGGHQEDEDAARVSHALHFGLPSPVRNADRNLSTTTVLMTGSDVRLHSRGDRDGRARGRGQGHHRTVDDADHTSGRCSTMMVYCPMNLR